MNKYVVIISMVMCFKPLLAQIPSEGNIFGFRVGANMVKIQNIGNTIIRPWHPINTYTVKESYPYGLTFTVFGTRRFNDRFAGQLEMSLNTTFGKNKKSNLSYQNTLGLNYEMNLNYTYLSVPLFVEIYPVNDNVWSGGFSVNLGAVIGFNISNSNIIYTSNQPDLGPDLQIQENLRSVLKGNPTLISFLSGIGYDYNFNDEMIFSLDGRFLIGLTDAVETLSNGYNFIENKNIRKSFEISLGIAWVLN